MSRRLTNRSEFAHGAFLLAAALAVAMPETALAAPALDMLVAAYPQKISGLAENAVVFRDGTRQEIGAPGPEKPFAERLAHATIADMFRLAYPMGAPLLPPAEDFDPGRFRNRALFDRLYGDCRKGEVEKTLVSVQWLAQTWGGHVKFAPEAANALRAVSTEIDALPAKIKRAAYPTAGTYACRGVADLGQPSMHAYGAAIDLNLKYSSYWLWDTHGAAKPVWRNRMPREIVDAFERHGFIWGGRWYHYDTMHFEYRPELLAPAR